MQFTSRLDYCNSLYFGIGQSALSRLQIVQNAAARLLTCTKKQDHIIPVLCSLHWLPVRYRVNFKILLLVFKSLNGLAPAYQSDLLIEHRPLLSLRLSNQRLLCIPKSKLKCRGDRAFSVAAPRLWNALPLCIRSAPSLSVFKSMLKTYLFDLAFYQWVLFIVLFLFAIILYCLIWIVFIVQHIGQPMIVFNSAI